MDTVILGAGTLNWHADERRTDRYGTVHLNRTPSAVDHDATPNPERFNTAPVGAHGRLVAIIVGTRPAHHIGDLARGATPKPAPVDTESHMNTSGDLGVALVRELCADHYDRRTASAEATTMDIFVIRLHQHFTSASKFPGVYHLCRQSSPDNVYLHGLSGPNETIAFTL